MKKYLLSADSYMLQGADGHNCNSYELKDGEFLVLKEQKDIEYMNLENFVGGGEAFDYDLIAFDDAKKVVYVRHKREGTKNTISAAFDPEKISKEELSEAIEKGFVREGEEMELSFETLPAAASLEELSNIIPENDFAQREIGDEEGRRLTLEYLEKGSGQAQPKL